MIQAGPYDGPSSCRHSRPCNSNGDTHVKIGEKFPLRSAEECIQEATKLSAANPAEAIRLANQGLQVAEECGDERNRARAIRARGMGHGSQGDIAAAVEDFTAALEIGSRIGDRKLKAQCLHGLGVACFYLSELARAMEYMYRAITLRREDADDAGLITSLNSLGAFLGSIGNYPAAVEALTEALQVSRRQTSDASKRCEGSILGNLALFRMNCGDFDEAISLFEESIAISEATDDRLMLANNLPNFADALRKHGRLEAALAIAEKGVRIAGDLGNPYLETMALVHLGQVCLESNSPDCAGTALLGALQMARAHNSDRQLPGILICVGTFYQRQGELESAERFVLEALAIASRTEQKQEIADAHFALSGLYQEMGRCAEALDEYRAYHEVDKDLQKQSAGNRMVAQMAQMEVERANRQAEALRLLNADLAEANRQKAALLSDLKRQAGKLAREAIEDSLTGLYNRRYLTAYLGGKGETAEANVASLSPSIAIADLDNFKQINDRFSHRIGDIVLQTVARLFQSHVRRGDVVARYGGEEFVVVLPDSERKSAQTVCERVRQAVADYPWGTVHPDLRVTLSVGTADSTEDPPPMLTPEKDQPLLALADRRLYEAKRQGKNRVV